jgi:hypothetical protein
MSMKARIPATRRNLPVFIGRVACITLLTACGGRKAEQAVEPEQHRPPTPRLAQTAPVTFDVPSLIGKSIDELRRILGTPIDNDAEPTDLQLRMGVDEWNNAFAKDGEELLVTFDPRTRRVRDLFLGGSDRTVLMQQCNVVEGATGYRVESVRALRNPAEITGIKIAPTGGS